MPLVTWFLIALSEMLVCTCTNKGFPGGHSGEESTCQRMRLRFDPWVKKIPWSRKWQPTPVFLRSLAGYSPWGRRESTRLQHTCKQSCLLSGRTMTVSSVSHSRCSLTGQYRRRGGGRKNTAIFSSRVTFPSSRLSARLAYVEKLEYSDNYTESYTSSPS